MDDPARAGGMVTEQFTVTAAVIDDCLSGLGPDLLAYLLGAGVDGALADWRLESALMDPRTRARLTAIHDLLGVFADRRAARAWLRNINPELRGRSPAEVIRCGADDLQAVREVAERYVAKGNDGELTP